ncbi:cell division protein ZapE [Kineococcus arenarius]|uniref:cell division protein ZapE n=1 Tax=Kineococcus sp. SYSU DK007 TaxID=3383128 RepID=UPI003D7D7A5C
MDDLRRGFDTAASAVGSRLEPAQRIVAERLAKLGADVLHQQARGHRGVLRRRTGPVQGVYLHGAVGRGKTWLTEALLHQLPAAGVLRLHAYDAARQLHAHVARDVETPGAVQRAVSRLLDGVDLLYVDEFHAHDPGDAMLLARLVRALPAHRAALVATSNHPPHALLPDPRFHHLVLSLIAALEESCDVVELAGDLDHRSHGHGGARPGWSGGAWRVTTPVEPGTAATGGTAQDVPAVVHLAGRPLAVRAVTAERVRVSFAALCEGRTAVSDVLELAERYATVELVGVPRLSSASAGARRRFAGLVDVLCDADVRLLVEAVGPLEDVVDTDDLDHERMRSRLRLLGTAVTTT